MTRSALTALAVILMGGSCGEPTSPEILGRFEIVPPSEYQTWWDNVESCSGQTGDISRVRWFVVEAFPERPELLGQWNSNHEITVRNDVRAQELVISHEILHELLDGDGDHQDIAWVRCGLPVGMGG